MEKVSKPIIVPWDFTDVAHNAFLHAVNFSRTLECDIILLHIVAEEKEISDAETKLKTAAAELGKELGKTPVPVIKMGSIFTSIGESAAEYKAEMIIMGTHGIKGAQKLFGSRAVKVVVSSRTPFLIVQDKPANDKIESILLPIDFKKENKEKANWIFHLYNKFEFKVTIFRSHPKDKGFKRKLMSNMKYIETFLKTHNVEYHTVVCEGKKKFKEEVVEYASSHNFDMILIMATRDIKTVDYLFGAPEQYIIANKHSLPVMCINPRPMRIAGGFRASGGA